MHWGRFHQSTLYFPEKYYVQSWEHSKKNKKSCKANGEGKEKREVKGKSKY